GAAFGGEEGPWLRKTCGLSERARVTCRPGASQCPPLRCVQTISGTFGPCRVAHASWAPWARLGGLYMSKSNTRCSGTWLGTGARAGLVAVSVLILLFS